MKSHFFAALTVCFLISFVVSACVAGPGDDDAGLQVEPDVDLPPVYFSIVFDYRFDEDAFFDARKKAVLEEAANAWGRILLSDFPAVAAGVPLLTRNPQRPEGDAQRVELDDDIDDLLVFVGAGTLDGIGGVTARSYPTATVDVGDDALGAELRARSDGEAFQPWTGWLTFDKDEIWFVDDSPTTDDDVDGQVPDLFTNAMHELGHILGVGTSTAFLNYAADGFFTGPASVEVFGGPVPVTATGQHLMDGFEFEGEEPLMNRTDANGERHRPTLLDIALLQDIGYVIE